MTIKGQSLRWLSDDIARLAIVDDAKIQLALRRWQRLVPPQYRTLLTRGKWNGTKLKFVGVSDDDLKRLVLVLIGLIVAELRAYTNRLAGGTITIAEWQKLLSATLIDLHIALAIAGAGGSGQYSAKHQAQTSARLREQLRYLERFARQIELGHRQANTPERLQSRTKLYPFAANRTYEENRRLSAQAWRFSMERNVLGIAEHCPECLSLTALGWQPIGSIKPPGTRLCLVNCKCRIQYAIPAISEKSSPPPESRT